MCLADRYALIVLIHCTYKFNFDTCFYLMYYCYYFLLNLFAINQFIHEHLLNFSLNYYFPTTNLRLFQQNYQYSPYST